MCFTKVPKVWHRLLYTMRLSLLKPPHSGSWLILIPTRKISGCFPWIHLANFMSRQWPKLIILIFKDNLYIYKIEAKKVLGNATTHRALVLSSWNFNTDPAQYGRWTLVKIIWIGPRVPDLGPYLGRALSFGESFEALKWDFAGKFECIHYAASIWIM